MKLTKFLCMSSILFLILDIMLSNMLNGFIIMSWTNTKGQAEQEELKGWAHMPHGCLALSVHKHLYNVYKPTRTQYSELNVSYMCAIWGTVTRTFTFYHLTTCDIVTFITKLQTKSSMKILMSLFRIQRWPTCSTLGYFNQNLSVWSIIKLVCKVLW